MSSSAVVFESKPALKHPVLILSFSGWNDAGASATTAVRYLTEQFAATKFASIDPEEFYDFTMQRPQVRLIEGMQRQVQWPAYDLYYTAGIAAEKDFILGTGAEPHLKWRAFCDTILHLVKECQIEMIVTLGAYLDEVLYTRPVPLTGFSTDQKFLADLDLIPSRYQGPTGIVGVLGDFCRRMGLPNLSLWAALPHYLPFAPNPRGALALVLRITQWFGVRVDMGPLERAAGEFQNKVNEAVNTDPNLSAFIRELKKREFEQ